MTLRLGRQQFRAQARETHDAGAWIAIMDVHYPVPQRAIRAEIGSRGLRAPRSSLPSGRSRRDARYHPRHAEIVMGVFGERLRERGVAR